MKSFDILVVGDGLSSLLFCYGFQQNKKVKVDVLSPNFKNELTDQNYKIKDKLKIPYHFTSQKNIRDIKNYFVANKITFDKKKLEICGILGKGGLSNYWGAQVDLNNTEDLNFLGKSKLNKILLKHTGQPLEKIEQDTDRDRFMSAEEACEYHLIDEVIEQIPTG